MPANNNEIEKRLERRAFEIVAAPDSFFVVAAQGPLKDSGPERVAAWAADLAESIVTTAVG